MLGPMQAENSFHLYSTFALGRDRAYDSRGRKADFGILLALQNLFVHLAIAAVISTLATRGVNDKSSTGCAGGGVEIHAPAFCLESTVNRVQHITQREAHSRFRRIELKSLLLSKRSTAQQQRQSCANAQARSSLANFVSAPKQFALSHALMNCHPSAAAALTPTPSGEVAPVWTASNRSNNVGSADSALSDRRLSACQRSITSITADIARGMRINRRCADSYCPRSLFRIADAIATACWKAIDRPCPVTASTEPDASPINTHLRFETDASLRVAETAPCSRV